MEWQQIIGFYNLVKHENFTRAAYASFRTQSALSQQIRKLEDELQCQLINRDNHRQFTLTQSGERFYHFVSYVLGEHQRLIDDLSEIKGLPKGRLKIAAPFTTLYHLFPGQFKSFMTQYPHIELTIFDRPQSKVQGLLKRSAIDIGIVLASQVSDEFKVLKWKEVDTVLIVADDHPLTRIKKPSPHDIAKYPLILSPKTIASKAREALEELFRKNHLDYRIVMESSNVELSSRYVEEGLGIAFGTAAREQGLLKGRKIKFISLGHLFKPDHISLIVRKDRELPRYMEAFIQQVLDSG